MRDRIKKIRNTLGLTQKEFGLNLGCSRDKISNIELGRVVPDEVFIKHICVIYKVNEHWMRTGEGEMWESKKNETYHKLTNYDNLSPISKSIVDSILDMSDKERQVFESFIEKLLPLSKNYGDK